MYFWIRKNDKSTQLDRNFNLINLTLEKRGKVSVLTLYKIRNVKITCRTLTRRSLQLLFFVAFDERT